MPDRLFVGVLGNRNSGKSTTWNSLFGTPVRTGSNARMLELRRGECVEVFLISGSPEERDIYAGDVLRSQTARIILCSMQYVAHVIDTIDYVENEEFWSYVQWLNPGYSDEDVALADSMGIANRLLYMGATLAIRSGKVDPSSRVKELREFIYGWASFRELIVAC